MMGINRADRIAAQARIEVGEVEDAAELEPLMAEMFRAWVEWDAPDKSRPNPTPAVVRWALREMGVGLYPNSQYRELLIARFGLDGRGVRGVAELGRVLEVSRSAVRSRLNTAVVQLAGHFLAHEEVWRGLAPVPG